MVTTHVVAKQQDATTAAAATLVPPSLLLDARKQLVAASTSAPIDDETSTKEHKSKLADPALLSPSLVCEENQRQQLADDAADVTVTSSRTDSGALTLPTSSPEIDLPTTSTPPTHSPVAEALAPLDSVDSIEPLALASDDSDVHTSSCSESSARFSLIDLPAKVRASFFPRKPTRKLKRKKPRGNNNTNSNSNNNDAGTIDPSLPLTLEPPAAVALSKTLALVPSPSPTTTETDKSGETFKHFWDERLRSTMEKLKLAKLQKPDVATTDVTSDADAVAAKDVFHVVLQLYAHQDVVDELYKRCETHAADFAFYIPQLCTFLLHGNYAKQHQLECFLLSRSGESLAFAHRLTWFVRSFCDDARRYASEYLSVTAANDAENSDLLSAIEQRAGVPALLMHNGLCVEEVTTSKPSNLLRRRSSIFAIDEEMDASVLASDETFAGHLQTKRQRVMYEARPDEGNDQQTTLFKQTPDFVTALTDLADALIPVPLPQRLMDLRAGLHAIQSAVLPSDVLYLPVGNTHHRVKAIHVDECFAFSTKERVPYFLVVEVLDYAVDNDAIAAAAATATTLKQQAATTTKSLRKKKAQRVAPAAVASTAAAAATVAAAAATPVTRPPARGFSLYLPFLKSAVPPAVVDSDAASTPATDALITPALVDSAALHGGHTSDSSVLSESAPLRLSERVTDCTDRSSGAVSLLSAPPVVTTTTTAAATVAVPTPSVPLSVVALTPPKLVETTITVAAVAPTPSVSFAPAAFFGYFLGTSSASSATAASKQSSKQSPQRADMRALEAAGALALTPREPLDGGEDGDDEKEDDDDNALIVRDTAAPARVDTVADAAAATNESDDATREAAALLEQATEEQNQRMGQWSLPRATTRRRGSRSSASARSNTQFDTFYSSWFAKKQKHEKDEVCTHPESVLTAAADVAADAKAATTAAVEAEDTLAAGGSTESVVEPEFTPPATEVAPAAALAAALTTPATPAAAAVDANDDTSADERSAPRKRDRDLSMSLDFTDSNAWRVKFDLEDALTDNEEEEEGEEEHDGTDSDEHAHDATATTAATTTATTNDAHASSGAAADGNQNDDVAVDEAPIIVFRERWSEKEARLRQLSPYHDHPGWRLLSVIVKSNDDLRQEQFAAQLIAQCDRIFKAYKLPLRLRPYNVIATSATTGLIEAVPDTVSLDSLKRNDPEYTTLLDFYTRLHGDQQSVGFARARRNFVESLAAYSIACYVLQIKDRHNGNILIDTQGHVIHIDFGFLLTNSPGSNLNFERAPFKLTDEFVELMGGPRSSTFRYFRSLCIRAFLALQRSMDELVLLVEMMLVGNSDLPCFAGGKRAVVDGLKTRLQVGKRTSACQLFVNQLIDQSINNWRTRWYDKYQRACLGIL